MAASPPPCRRRRPARHQFRRICRTRPSTRVPAELTEFLDRLAITYDPITPAAAHLAGLTFKRYGKAGGQRQHLIPDFLIAAHALTQSHRLAAIDRGYLRIWFPDLKLLAGSGA